MLDRDSQQNSKWSCEFLPIRTKLGRHDDMHPLQDPLGNLKRQWVQQRRKECEAARRLEEWLIRKAGKLQRCRRNPPGRSLWAASEERIHTTTRHYQATRKLANLRPERSVVNHDPHFRMEAP